MPAKTADDQDMIESKDRKRFSWQEGVGGGNRFLEVMRRRRFLKVMGEDLKDAEHRSESANYDRHVTDCDTVTGCII